MHKYNFDAQDDYEILSTGTQFTNLVQQGTWYAR